MKGDTKKPGGFIREEHYTQVQDMFQRDKCTNNGQGKFSADKAIARARRMVDKELHYNLLSCNCEHYVKYWVGRNEFWNQSGSPPDSCCGIWAEKQNGVCR